MSMHESVLLQPAIDALDIKPDGCYIDATLGGGGHTTEILRRLGAAGCVFAYDQDLNVIEQARADFSDSRLSLKHAGFTSLQADMKAAGLDGKVNGILLDLGVSSMQLDQSDRGFSFRHDGPLDMRMDTTQGMTAGEWLNQADERTIATVIWEYGQERFSRRIARAIVRERQMGEIKTTAQLSKLVSAAMPYSKQKKHPATRTFQAIRIFVNQELAALEAVLPQCKAVLAAEGRLVVISFHSLEDGIVKRFMRGPSGPPRSYYADLTVQTKELPSMDYIARVVPDSQEVKRNPRARSAVMRYAARRGV